MRITLGLATVLGTVLTGGAAAQPVFELPVDCAMGQTCFVQQYMDIDPGPGVVDAGCGTMSYDGHRGLDIRVPTVPDLAAGIPILAAADGVVQGKRDGERDHRIVNAADRRAVRGKECGNGVVIDHGDGWVSQYCHLAEGSILVGTGAQVSAGQVIGRMGLSGRTEFPHLHFGVRHNGTVVDPFLGSVTACEEDASFETALWSQDALSQMPYGAGQTLEAGFAGGTLSLAQLIDGAPELPALGLNQPIVAWSLTINLQPGDRIGTRITGPNGVITDSLGKPIETPKAQWLGFAGRKAPQGGWPPGAYQAEVWIDRGGRRLSPRAVTTTLAAAP